MSTVTLSKPHCAIISAEKPEGIASQAFTTALPEAQICLTLLFGIARVSSLPFAGDRDLARRPLNGDFADAHLARGVHYRRPGIIRQGHAVPGAFGAGLSLRVAGDQDLIDAGNRLGLADEIDIAGDLAIEEIGGIDHLWVDIEGKHTVGEAPVRRGGAGPGQRAAEQFADERQPRALVLAEGADGAGPLGVLARPVGRVRAIEHMRILTVAAVGIDQRALWQLLAAAARDQALALGDDRGREIEHDRVSPLARNADAIGRGREPLLDAAERRH